MEYTQWEINYGKKKYYRECLNPCCNGIYSMSKEPQSKRGKHIAVLILVVMEYTQWVMMMMLLQSIICLNPCCNGIYSMRDARETRRVNDGKS